MVLTAARELSAKATYSSRLFFGYMARMKKNRAELTRANGKCTNKVCGACALTNRVSLEELKTFIPPFQILLLIMTNPNESKFLLDKHVLVGLVSIIKNTLKI